MTQEVNELIIPRWFDRHLHIRDGEMLKTVLPCTLNQHVSGALIMGNLKFPDQTSTIAKTLAYRERIVSLLPTGSDFKPRMTCYLTDDITGEEVLKGFRGNVWCGMKLYMSDQKGEGGTTGSRHGVKNLLGRYRVFEIAEKYGIPLLGHFEAVESDVDEFDREIVSVERDLIPLLSHFPNLKVVFEHVSDGRAADFVADSPYNIQATVTAHHLMINRNAMFKEGMNPGHYCKPVPKRESDRMIIRKYVTSGNRRFGAGTDSAPHDEAVKARCYGCSAGIFTAPKAVEMYTTVFDEDGALAYLGSFLSENFLGIYGMEVSTELMKIKRVPSTIPTKVGNVPVFRGGTLLPWKLIG